ncbi:flagellar biosynthetic protein FliO [Desulforhopalus sp. IMCC35007]|uniref:flagellar biosynthetic protein FliO n=1 Tax=Desulforhopalus sp. IMCC35007 TaxID=2569543 RepID=UPI00145E2A8C|nr:flagellar biosynthetic protein FliO [Desulforhopalus sp. IMCC35007]
MKTTLASAVIVLLCISTAFAESTKPLGLYDNSDILTSSFRVVWGLLIVLGIILLLYGLLRKRFSLLSSSPDKQINIIEIKPLMGKKALCLVEIRGTEYLLGISESNISNIATLPAKKKQSFSKTLQAETGEKYD